jgi:MSHA pilin protein MshD
MSNRHRNNHSRGFTLIELIIFIVVVSAALAGILSVMNTVVKSSADPMVRKQTIAIAESLLEEILLKEYADPAGGYSGSDRALFDDVSDYHGYTTTGGIAEVFNMTSTTVGAPVAGLGSYNIAPPVTVAAATLGSLTVMKITVSVTGPGGTISLTGYRSNY